VTTYRVPQLHYGPIYMSPDEVKPGQFHFGQSIIYNGCLHKARTNSERDECKHKLIHQSGLGCALGFGTMHAHKSTVRKENGGQGE
jgi:hypothetical protein